MRGRGKMQRAEREFSEKIDRIRISNADGAKPMQDLQNDLSSLKIRRVKGQDWRYLSRESINKQKYAADSNQLFFSTKGKVKFFFTYLNCLFLLLLLLLKFERSSSWKVSIKSELEILKVSSDWRWLKRWPRGYWTAGGKWRTGKRDWSQRRYPIGFRIERRGDNGKGDRGNGNRC